MVRVVLEASMVARARVATAEHEVRSTLWERERLRERSRREGKRKINKTNQSEWEWE